MSPELNPEFAVNPEARCACVLLVDTSGSMTGAPIAALNDGLRAFQNDLLGDPVASLRVEVAVVAFNSTVDVTQPFVGASSFSAPSLQASGQTYMAAAIEKALDLVQERKDLYKKNGVPFYRPWVFMITDGKPEGENTSYVDSVTAKLHQSDEQKRVAFFGVGVQGADMQRLTAICPPGRPPMSLDGLKFGPMFVWLSRSLGNVSRSKTNDTQVPLEPTTGWSILR